MARIAGIDIPRNKRIDISITYVFGIGRTNGAQILERANVNPATRVRDLTEEELVRIREIVEREFRVEGDLRREIQMNIKRLMDIACYRGLRHRKGLPVRGQRTRTNARTRRGRKGRLVSRRRQPRSNSCNMRGRRNNDTPQQRVEESWQRQRQPRVVQRPSANVANGVSAKMYPVVRHMCRAHSTIPS